jgi:TolA-binding protein
MWLSALLALAAGGGAGAGAGEAQIEDPEVRHAQEAQQGQAMQTAGQPVQPSAETLRTPEERRAANRAIYNGVYQEALFAEPKTAEQAFAQAQQRMEQVNPGDDGDASLGAALFQRGYLLREAGEYDKALELFAELVRRYPRNPYADDALYYSGWIWQFKKEDYEKAAAAYSRVAEMYADRETAGKAMYQNAQVAVMSNDDDNVNPRLNKAVELTTNDRKSRGQKFAPNYYETQAREQIKFIDRNTLGLASQRPVNMYLQADNFMRQGRLNEAEGNLQTIARDFPQAKLADDAAFGLAECRRRAGKLDEAVRLYSEFLERHPDSELAPRARFMLAELKRVAGLDAEARELYVRVRQQLKELPPELKRCLEATEARLKEMATEQPRQMGK